MRKYTGFTLVEMLAVIAIMGVLVTLSLVPIRTAQKRNRDAQRKTDLNVIAQSIDLYYAENRTLPERSGSCSYMSREAAPWIPNLTARYLPSTNNQQLPVDPLKNNPRFYYKYTNNACLQRTSPGLAAKDGRSFTLETFLENDKDPEGEEVSGRVMYRVVR